MIESLLHLAREQGGAAVLIALLWAGVTVLSLRLKYRARTPRATSRTILLAEDDPASAAAVLHALERELPGISVLAVSTVEEAEQVLSSQTPPAVAIVDCHLSDGDGWKIAVRAPRKTAVVLVSDAMRASALRRLAEGVDALHLRKPLDLDELVRLIREHLKDPT